MAVSDYSTTPDENVTISGINIAEGCAPSGINNAIRQMMADIKTSASTYLPLSGGTLTDEIKRSGTLASNTSTSTSLNLCGGVDFGNGAILVLRGKDQDIGGGNFEITANDGTLSPSLVGTADGSLTWSGNTILNSANYGTYCLPIAGGAMTGEIKSNGNAVINTGTDGSTNFLGGTNLGNGAHLVLRGKDQTSTEGQFELSAHDGTTERVLKGTPSGALTWDDRSICLVPDYASQVVGGVVSSGTKITVSKTSLVIVYGTDSYTIDAGAYVYSPSGGQFIVGSFYSDVNSNTRGTSFSFIVPAGWSFSATFEAGFSYREYPMAY